MTLWQSLIKVIKFLASVLPVLINVAFVTLLERKILGYSQLRLGPNKISFMGVLQPFRDAIKLFAKQYELNSNVN
jgi:NADH:ubiquinone oxidoreductase subunit H